MITRHEHRVFSVGMPRDVYDYMIGHEAFLYQGLRVLLAGVARFFVTRPDVS